MNSDAFAFFNQQLATMLRDGIPLESALQRLTTDMRVGALRSELEQLQADLARGIPLTEAVGNRQLPELYRRMLAVGAQSNNLPAILTMLADYYQRRNLVWTRLKGLMVYPAIVLGGAFLLSCFLAILLGNMNSFVTANFFWQPPRQNAAFAVWFSPSLLALAILVACVIALTPSIRRRCRWRIAAFRDASLAQTAAALSLMLKSGVSLDQALQLLEQMEGSTPAGAEITTWRQRLAAGHARFPEIGTGGTVFPPLFVWTVSQSQENLAAGFDRAAEVYQRRATYRTDLLLYSALPCSIIVLALVIIWQIQPTIAAFVAFMNGLSN
ncbi:MAG: gspF, partial [Verrucomicrobiales bacterium]|nr:gspF [Verrucomicrobiales bacterium]